MTMLLVFTFFIASVFLELAAAFTRRRNEVGRTIIVASSIGLLCALAIYMLVVAAGPWAVFLTFPSAYRIVNLLRCLKGRMHPHYLRVVCLRTTLWLSGSQAGVALLWLLWEKLSLGHLPLLFPLVILQLLAALAMMNTVRRHVRHASTPLPGKAYADRELPTVTVAIAARNETESLVDCLESILSSDYPKLEIIVLDDCSQNRRTAEIIRHFAHAGVRFVPGKEPKPSWLARNQAYQTLAKEASGDNLLFCSTSVRLQPQSIRRLVSYMLTRQKTMLSVMPRSRVASRRLLMVEPLRAAWELLLPRRYVLRPPVIDSCWLIRSSSLKRAGGFAAVSRMVVPEVYFARKTAANDGYSFAPGGLFYGVTSETSLEDQQVAVVRSDYPILHRRPEMVALATSGLLLFGVLPFALVFAAIFSNKVGTGLWIVSLLALAACLLLWRAYHLVLRLSYKSAPPLSAAGFWVTALAAIVLQHYSMYKYEFGSVVWKDRNICLPVMHVVSHLPNL